MLIRPLQFFHFYLVLVLYNLFFLISSTKVSFGEKKVLLAIEFIKQIYHTDDSSKKIMYITYIKLINQNIYQLLESCLGEYLQQENKNVSI